MANKTKADENLITLTDGDGVQHALCPKEFFKIGTKSFALLASASDPDETIILRITVDGSNVPQTYEEPSDKEWKAAAAVVRELGYEIERSKGPAHKTWRPSHSKTTATKKGKAAPEKASDPAAGALARNDERRVLDYLNELAPDTLDEGEYPGWRFTKLERKSTDRGTVWKLYYTNSRTPKVQCVAFRHQGPCLVQDNVSTKWVATVFKELEK